MEAFDDPPAATQGGDALLVAKACKKDADLLLGRLLFAGLSLYPLTNWSAASFAGPDVLFIFVT
jgi:hypothetical protein